MSKRTANVLTFGRIHWLSSDSIRIWKAHAWVKRKSFFQTFLSFAQQDQHQSLQRPPHLNMLKQQGHARVWTPRSVFACSPSGPTSTTTQQPSSSPSRSSINGKRKSETSTARLASEDFTSANTLETQNKQICRSHCPSHWQRQLGMQPRISCKFLSRRTRNRFGGFAVR